MNKFTVIITHFNQMKYIKTAILSILNQTYRNIELIIADDCSPEFDFDKIEAIIKKYNHHHYKYKILSGKKNLGTVKNLNNALKKATGDYILFFAADDKMANNHVIERFIGAFKDQNKNVITTQCGLYDEKLKNKEKDYVNIRKAQQLNQKTSKDIYEKMCEGCFYGSGGTAYRKSVFQKYGLFNEKYLFVEDWSYWLHILRNGEKIYYEDFDTLCHRDGGISHSEYTKETIPKHVKQYYKDILNIYVDEVLPYIDQFTTIEKYRILRQYNETILYYSSFVPELISYLKTFDQKRVSDNKLKMYWKFKTARNLLNPKIIQKIKILLKYNRTVPITVIFWLFVCLFIINQIELENKNILILLYIILYIIIYHIVYACDKIWYHLSYKRKQEKEIKNVQ